MSLHGSTPIHGAMMFAIDADGLAALRTQHVENGLLYAKVVQDIPLGDFPVANVREYAVRPIPAPNGVSRYELFFTADNGPWVEDLQTMERDGHILQSLRIRRPIDFRQTVIFQAQDAGFSQLSPDKLDWSWAVTNP